MRDSITWASVTACGKWAYGFRVAFAWFLTATCDISRAPMPCAASAREISPASAGMVAP